MIKLETQFPNKNTRKTNPPYGTTTGFPTSKLQQNAIIIKHKITSLYGQLLQTDFDNNT